MQRCAQGLSFALEIISKTCHVNEVEAALRSIDPKMCNSTKAQFRIITAQDDGSFTDEDTCTDRVFKSE
ncbi:hypothetical protein [Actibacterium sp. 188UL27-1]|uniref:hypothetical protein n=1 Tax=Actibacterium sp. 188UL27-1 TaxID=2786961 RepID=UPI0019598E75|nr:hypothetical protein [Actibacterium sp. 188UL27-1]MBM7068860.1 hypothetical protein [Actibacterium sp. 188UL27-1]